MKSLNRVRKDTKSAPQLRQEKAFSAEASKLNKNAANAGRHNAPAEAAEFKKAVHRTAREARAGKLGESILIEPVTAGRPLLPMLSEKEAAAFVALAMHNMRPALEKLCGSYIANDKQYEASQLAEALVIADAVVRRRVLAVCSM